MKKSVWVFGLVLGALLCMNLVYLVYLCYHKPDMERHDVLGYAIMVLVFSLTFFGIRNYRDRQLGGSITFGNAFKVGALIVLVGSTLYVAFWLPYYYLVVPDFLEHYIGFVLKDAARSGATAAELAAKTQEMAAFKEMYRNPLFIVLITYSEVAPVGLVVALVSALALRKKRIA